MSVNGVTSGSNVDYEIYNAGAGATASGSKPEDTVSKPDTGVVYEKSDKTETDSAKKTYTPNKELIAKLKSDTILEMNWNICFLMYIRKVKWFKWSAYGNYLRI